MNCSFGTKQAYDHCCGLYIEKKQIPSTALCLMRSRFSAYALNNIDYIASTMRGAPRQGFSKKKLLLENADIQWHSLAIIDATDNTVDFEAIYIDSAGEAHTMHERSLFKQTNNRWFYIGIVD